MSKWRYVYYEDTKRLCEEEIDGDLGRTLCTIEDLEQAREVVELLKKKEARIKELEEILVKKNAQGNRDALDGQATMEEAYSRIKGLEEENKGLREDVREVVKQIKEDFDNSGYLAPVSKWYEEDWCKRLRTIAGE